MRSVKYKSIVIACLVMVGVVSFTLLNTQLAGSAGISAVCPADLPIEEQVLPDAKIIQNIIEVALKYIPTLLT